MIAPNFGGAELRQRGEGERRLSAGNRTCMEERKKSWINLLHGVGSTVMMTGKRKKERRTLYH